MSSPTALATAQVSALHTSLAPGRRRLAARNSDILAAQVAVTEIAAPTGEESTRAAWMAHKFESLGLAGVHIDAAGNVSGTRSGYGDTSIDAPALVICAHLDTVFPREAIGSARREGARILAPGIGDNGRGLAAMLALAECIDGVQVRTRRPVRFVATTGEEGHGDLRGAKHHFAHGGPAFSAIALDGTGDERIVHRAVGSQRLRITLSGPGGHSWSDFGVANPLHAIAAAIAQLSAIPLPSHPRTTLTVARANGGMSVNSIPQNAWCEIDIRSTVAEPVRKAESALRAIVESAVAQANATRLDGTPPLTAQITVIGSRPCGELAEDHPLVEIARQATYLVGGTPELATASTDANVPLSLGIPAISIGAGGVGGEVHTTGEWYEDTDGARGIARALTIIVAATA